MTRLLVDFNDISGDDIARGLLSDATGPLHPGDHVLVYDGENECWATVRDVERDLAHVRLNWQTWADAGSSQEEPHPWVRMAPGSDPGTALGQPIIFAIRNVSGAATVSGFGEVNEASSHVPSPTSLHNGGGVPA